ncbi:MAG: hypothetical protein JSS75_04955 [Bacteroidetes bacterium]|nr:hypothetical protein [Bacteroidota bacterium]
MLRFNIAGTYELKSPSVTEGLGEVSHAKPNEEYLLFTCDATVAEEYKANWEERKKQREEAGGNQTT